MATPGDQFSRRQPYRPSPVPGPAGQPGATRPLGTPASSGRTPAGPANASFGGTPFDNAPFDNAPFDNAPFGNAPVGARASGNTPPANPWQADPAAGNAPSGNPWQADPAAGGAAGGAPSESVAWPPPSRPDERPPVGRRRDPAKSSVRKRVFISVGVMAALAVAGAGVYVGTRGGDAPPTAAAASPTAVPTVGPTRPPGRFGYAASRSTDPAPLTLNELFNRRKVTVGKRNYLMATRRTDKVCKNAVTGPEIQKAVKSAGCTQILRASYQDSKGEIIATIGVANLKTSAGAKKVGSAGAASERKDYLKPLPGKKGATKQLGTGEALAGAWTHGHYAVLLWFQFEDGHQPNTSERKRLNRTAIDIANKVVFPALDTRSLTGGHG